MSVKLSGWLLDGLDINKIVHNGNNNGLISTLADTDNAYSYTENYYSRYNAYGEYDNYSNYSRYSRYSDYDNTYSRYSRYSDYDNYANYSNTISISGQPVSQIITYGDKVTFTVTFSKTPSSYQWYVSTISSGGGTIISGATSSSYSFTPKLSDNGKYYYCVASLGNTVTSNSAQLTIKYIDSCNISTCIGESINIYSYLLPESSTIDTYNLEDISIATISGNNLIGNQVGKTTLTLISSNGLSKTVEINVFENKLESVLYNIAQAIKKYNNLNQTLYPNQFYNSLKSKSISSKNYNTLEDLFTDLSAVIKEIKGISTSLKPEEFFYKILESIKYD